MNVALIVTHCAKNLLRIVIASSPECVKDRSCALTGDPSKGPSSDEWLQRTGSRTQLWAAGYTGKDFSKPVVTVASPYMSIHMCNQLFRNLADTVGGNSVLLHSQLVRIGAVPHVASFISTSIDLDLFCR